ncbi:S41 family peptidase [Mucilaginibacter sp. E4BP6]|uniref:S41 family peptidase n=1 Tax=Mucilaginibacter sp. E4BP6 TaxID=2723089 RepID=UPI0015CB8E3C|nr:S41 family peptidase [Mucilaginibacter sp. E4BP6]NYE64935.1 Tol biopolymer transport system component [Mucilaginibacter sp. E4BP6]
MRKLLFLFAILWGQNLYAQSTPLLWIQQPALSPDGQWIAFEFKGNLYKVSSVGGNATPLTINGAYNGYPVWSHDGKEIAFASDRFGNFDVFIMPASGGEARRLTFNSAKDIPYDFSPDNSQVYYGTEAGDIYTSVRFPSPSLFTKLFRVSINGGSNIMINSAGTEYVHFNKEGTMFLFQDRKGYEDPYRKHHQSAVTRDIWLFDLQTKAYKKLSDYAGEDREPVWGNGNDFYYLSERNGDQNLYKSNIVNPSALTQLTFFEKNPVRNLSRSETGTIAFTQGGELYTLQEGQSLRKINIELSADFNNNEVKNITVKDGAGQIAVSPNGKEIAYVIRGEIYVSSTNGAGTKRITNTPYQEGMLQFSPDGRDLLYSVEHEQSWDIYKASIVKKNEPYFFSATIISQTPVIESAKDEFEGKYSPDGKKIAYLEERNILKVRNLDNGSTVTVLPEGNIFSFLDGDQDFCWSPDSKHLLIASSLGLESSDNVVLLNADGSKPVQLTHSGFNISNPQWTMGGQMIYFKSGKLGLKSSPTGPKQTDIYGVFLNKAKFDRFLLSKNDLKLFDEMKQIDSLANVSKKISKNDSLSHEKQQIVLDFDHLDDRTLRLSLSSAQIGDFKMSPDGEKLYYLARYDNRVDLWMTTPRTHDNKKLTQLDAGSGSLEISPDGKTLYLETDGYLSQIDTETGNKTAININSTMELHSEAERAYIYEHIVKEIPKRFFDPNLQGVDWTYYGNFYRKFLPYINNNYDFNVLISELLGELNSSHTGGSYYPSFDNGDQTATLGLLFDQKYEGSGLKVMEVLPGGPFDLADSKMKKGFIIDEINGTSLTTEIDPAKLLNHQQRIQTLINFHDPKTKATFEESIRPINKNEENSLLYKRWTNLMEHLTDSLSGGKIGYVHIAGMDEANYRLTIDQVEGRNSTKKALIIDTRFNAGGNLHEQLIDLFTEKVTLHGRPQGHILKPTSPEDGSAKPTCLLVSEGNYSDAFNFPYEYKRLKIGKLIGMPVAGTGTGVFWERQIDETLEIGLPMISLSWAGETSIMENHQLEPDIKIQNDYEQILNGHDQQLEAAIKQMLIEIK